MEMEVQVQGDCTHLFTVSIGSVLEAPRVGSLVLCPVCKAKRKIINVGIPNKVGMDSVPANPNQTSLFDKE